MRQEGENQILVSYIQGPAGTVSRGTPIEAGARGELISINSVRYTMTGVQNGASLWMGMFALSTNPEHEENPPASIVDFMESKALYAKFVVHYKAAGISINRVETVHVELYGLLRPRRQIWVTRTINLMGPDPSGDEKGLGLEVNYRPVKVDDITLSEYNNRYGLYKRK